MITIPNYEEKELSPIADQLLREFKEFKVWCFYAEMGCGKTTLIKQLCQKLGVGETVSSPTFAIINEYMGSHGMEIYHFDFYRLKDIEEAISIGTEDYFFSNNYCFCEWPEIIEPLLPDNYLKININLVGGNKRSLIAQPK
jgi:tRNA threonylcarbamoyladenosine biosynthesis protein TsaE